MTSKARRVAAEARYLLQVDPEGTLPIAERSVGRQAARRANMARIALLSVRPGPLVVGERLPHDKETPPGRKPSRPAIL